MEGGGRIRLFARSCSCAGPAAGPPLVRSIALIFRISNRVASIPHRVTIGLPSGCHRVAIGLPSGCHWVATWLPPGYHWVTIGLPLGSYHHPALIFCVMAARRTPVRNHGRFVVAPVLLVSLLLTLGGKVS